MSNVFSTEICNMALIVLGADTIINITEDSENARRLNVLYVPVLKDLLRLHPWNFALKRASLAQLVETPDFGYIHFFQLPSDYLRVVEINGQEDIDYVVEGDKLLCDEEAVNLRYIFFENDPTKFSSNFKQLFANRLAAEVAYAITGSRSIARDRWALYAEQLIKARSTDAQEGKAQRIHKSNWVGAR